MNDILKVPSLDHLAIDTLSIKIADQPWEIVAAQRLRYQVFYEEMGANPVGDMAILGYEYDEYDPICQHLLVVDNSLGREEQIVGTYRMLSLHDANRHGVKLYTETEFNLDKLKAKGGNIVEVSRSCVAAPHRTKAAINLLWKGIAQSVFSNKVDYLVGVPSLHGTDPHEHHDTLAYLNAFHAAPDDIRPRVVDNAYVPLPTIDKDTINQRRAFMALPPLVKGYMRLGAVIADGVYVDKQFNTTDIGIIVAINEISDNYFNHYKRHDVDAAS